MSSNCLSRAMALACTLAALVAGCSDDRPVAPRGYGVLEGRVVDRESGLPIWRAIVTISPGPFTLSTDSTGRFVIRGLEPGRYTVNVAAENHYVDSAFVTVGAFDTVRPELPLTSTTTARTPTVPQLLLPTGGTTSSSPEVLFVWSRSTTADSQDVSYELEIATGGGAFATVRRGVRDTSATVMLTYGTVYRWRVRAMSGRMIDQIRTSMWQAVAVGPNGAIEFGSPGGRVRVPYTSDLNGAGRSLTLEGRVRLDDTTRRIPMLSRRSGTALDYELVVERGGIARLMLGGRPDAPLNDVRGTIRLGPGWHHIAAIVDLAASSITLYIDRQQNVFTPLVSAPGVGNGDLYLCGNEDGLFESAAFDELRIWSVALTRDELVGASLAPVAGTSSGLVACWRFDRVDDDTVDDIQAGHRGLVTGPYRVVPSGATKP